MQQALRAPLVAACLRLQSFAHCNRPVIACACKVALQAACTFMMMMQAVRMHVVNLPASSVPSRCLTTPLLLLLLHAQLSPSPACKVDWVFTGIDRFHHARVWLVALQPPSPVHGKPAGTVVLKRRLQLLPWLSPSANTAVAGHGCG